ncbi:DUF547 domain-containing protein [Halovenus salina]|uniref:DUF547 domain-containing protein n=1 Tax=Halovenus salina TaxID=1510225 RepID=A0ABD5VY78_9EURY|nr:DUF547 domain-containing protein [Halovenus salina]
MTTDPVALSAKFLRSIRYDEPTDEYERKLANCENTELAARLDTDGTRLAFWCNLYNAATQQLLDSHREDYENRRTFFSLPALTVAGETLSLDDIEHDILRRSYSKLTFGYIRSPFRSGFAERHELDERDPRVHFALNCGAESCPPIAAYTRDEVDDQLDLTTAGYLDQAVTYDAEANTVEVPRLMRWFRGDFRATGGRISFLRRFDQIPDDVTPDIVYDEWDWSFAPANFAEN